VVNNHGLGKDMRLGVLGTQGKSQAIKIDDKMNGNNRPSSTFVTIDHCYGVSFSSTIPAFTLE
jgi:hypothetical protein